MPAAAAWPGGSPEFAKKLELLVSWIGALDTQLNPSKQFRYKPLLLLAVIRVLDTYPDHGNRFEFDELWVAFRHVAETHGFAVSKHQFSQPYFNMRKDVDPEPVWCIEIAADPSEVDKLRADYPSRVRELVPFVYVNKTVWQVFASLEGRRCLREAATERCFSGTVTGLITEEDMNEFEDSEGLHRVDVEREFWAIKHKLARDPELTEGLDRHLTQTTAMPRSAAFEIYIKKLYDYRCAICGSSLRSPDGKPEVQSAHIYPKRLDGSDDPRNGICLCRRHHWALDAGWISIADDHTILLRDDLPDHKDYRFIGACAGKKIRSPFDGEAAPHSVFLQQHRKLNSFE